MCRVESCSRRIISRLHSARLACQQLPRTEIAASGKKAVEVSMRKPEQSPEPSIEEILASIRRIIADDGAQVKPEAVGPTYPQGRSRPQPSHYTDAGRAPRDDRFLGRDISGPVESQEESEILELTEDIMLEEGPGPAEETFSTPQESGFESPKSEPAPSQSQMTRDDFDELGLQTVLSNVAAEVDRLASSDQRGLAKLPAEESLKQPAAQSVQPTQQSPAPPRSEVPVRQEDVSKAIPSARGAPVSPPQRPAPPKAHSRTVWSARHLENDGATQPPPPNTDENENQSSAVKSENRARTRSASGRDHWAEGVQMPVPESGPAMPFPYLPEERSKANVPEAHAQDEEAISGEQGREPDADKQFVGDFLTRVFANSPEQDEDKAEPDGTAKEDKAHALAKSAVADFASDKLNAPSVAGALHADKRFMETITDSLETALAEAERAEDSMLDTRSNALEADDLPDVPPPPDTEFLVSIGHLEDEQNQPLAEQKRVSDPLASQGAASQSGAISLAEEASSPVSLPVEEELAQDTPLIGEGSLPANLEESIKEMIKPLIIQWLNENLARIVEKAVREEVAERVPSVLRAKTSGQR
jgi:hypothetical protein